MTTIREALIHATRILSEAELRSPRQDAEFILTSVLSRNRAYLLAHPRRPLSRSQHQLFRQWLEKRRQHYPLQYLKGRQEFYGRDFEVAPGVLIPRPETELLAEAALRRLAALPGKRLRVVEVGLGSGCLGETLILEEARVVLTGIDISPAALAIARRNARRLGAIDRLHLLACDGLSALAAQPAFDLLVSNPPYGALGRSHLVDQGVRRYEPREAVFGGKTGLEVYAKIFAGSAWILKPSARVLVEIGQGQRKPVSDLAQGYGWGVRQVLPDLAGIDRVIEFEHQN